MNQQRQIRHCTLSLPRSFKPSQHHTSLVHCICSTHYLPFHCSWTEIIFAFLFTLSQESVEASQCTILHRIRWKKMSVLLMLLLNNNYAKFFFFHICSVICIFISILYFPHSPCISQSAKRKVQTWNIQFNNRQGRLDDKHCTAVKTTEVEGNRTKNTNKISRTSYKCRCWIQIILFNSRMISMKCKLPSGLDSDGHSASAARLIAKCGNNARVPQRKYILK